MTPGTGKDLLGYDRLVERALRGVMRDALRVVALRGLPGGHHFYLSFLTDFPGVEVPDYLRERYPEEMTIVLQYEFYGLDVSEDMVAVTLSFGGHHERLVIPFAAVTTFADPWVHFVLQFKATEAAAGAGAEARPLRDGREGGEVRTLPGALPGHPTPPRTDAGEGGRRGEVVALDAFRKK